MTKTRIVCYVVTHDNYLYQTARTSRNFEFAKTRKQADRWVQRMGLGAIITQTSQTRSGKRKQKVWVLNRLQNQRING